MNRCIAMALALALAGCGQAGAQTALNRAAEEEGGASLVKADHPGRAIFDAQCAACHGAGPGDDGMPMLPGTMTLAAKYDGQRPGALELRSDLTAPVLRFFVRNGVGAMPMFRKAELSDADIDALAAYLKATAELNGNGDS